METKVTFETAALADSLKKAERLSGKGKVFDATGGIVMELLPDQGLVVIRSTNNDVFYREWVTAQITLGDGAENVAWRMPTGMLVPVISSLPIGANNTVTFTEKPSGMYSYIEFRSGRTKGKFNLMDMTHFPDWEVFSPDDLTPVSDMGGRIGQVEWAAAKDTAPFNGVHFTGEEVQATDRYRMATMPLVIPGIPGPVTVPAGILGGVLKQTGEVNLGFTDSQMLIMPDPMTQIRVVLYGSAYPDLKRITDREHPDSVEFKKNELLDIINRAVLAGGGDRLLGMHLSFGKEQIIVSVKQDDTAIQDRLDVPGQCLHEHVSPFFTPKNLTDLLTNAPNDTIRLHYSATDASRIIWVDGGSGYEAWAAVRKDTSTN